MSDVTADLPRDVFSEILVRLPAKSIGRSRCVSKVWLSLLTSYDFIKAHLAHHSRLPQEQNLLLYCEWSPLFSLTLDPPGGNHLKKLEFFDEPVINVVGSCNGLVLVATERNVVWLINCLTEEYVKLPDSPFPLCEDYVFKKYGFGFDELSDDMKIVKISQCDYGQSEEPNCPEIYVDIYSLKMKSWRRIGSPLYGHDLLNYDSCVFTNGAFHWIGFKSKFKYSHKDPIVICAFDLSSEKFEEIPAPPVFGVGDIIGVSVTDSKLIEIDGCLGIVVHCRDPVEKIEHWYMKSYSVVESWTKLVIDIKPICFHEDKILFQKCRNGGYNWSSKERQNRDYKWYHLNDGRVDVCLVNDQEDAIRFNAGITYSESLLSPHFYSQKSKLKTERRTLNLAIGIVAIGIVLLSFLLLFCWRKF